MLSSYWLAETTLAPGVRWTNQNSQLINQTTISSNYQLVRLYMPFGSPTCGAPALEWKG
jgi:hypothetical protein